MIKIVVVALIGVFVSLFFKNINSNIGYVVAILTGVLIVAFLYDDAKNVIYLLRNFENGYGVQGEHIKLLLKVLGISYITQFGISVAEECGEKLIAKKLEFAGKIIVLSVSFPLLTKLLNSIISLI